MYFPSIKTKTFNNGLFTVLNPREEVNSAFFDLYIRYGNAYKEVRSALPHLMEHMVEFSSFEEMRSFMKENFLRTEAETWHYYTRYSVSSPPEKYNEALQFLMERVFEPCFKERVLKREKERILEEMGERREDPSFYFFDELLKWQFPSLEKPLESPLGSPKDLKGLGMRKIREEHEKIYTPYNMALFVSFPSKLEEKIEKAISLKSTNSFKELVLEEEERSLKKGERSERGEGKRCRFALTFPIPSLSSKEEYGLMILCELLEEDSFLLRIREEVGLYTLHIDFYSLSSQGFLYIYGVADSLSKRDKVVSLIEEELKKSVSFSKSEIKKAKERYLHSLLLDFESDTSTFFKMGDLFMKKNVFRTPEDIFE